MKKIEKTIELGGRELTLSTGHVAAQASGAVMAKYGETIVLATVVAEDMKNDPGYFPLHVEYRERLYAGGRIKGSRWVKREGRPSDDDILTARLVDRSIRPLFPSDYKKEVQVIMTVISVDSENSPEIPAAIATSAAIAISEIPWEGPIGITNVGLKEDTFITNPTVSEAELSDLDLVVSATKDSIVMVESGSNQVKEEDILEGIKHAQKEIAKTLDLINELKKEAGKDKEKVKATKLKPAIVKDVKKKAKTKIKDLVKDMATKKATYGDYDAAKAAVAEDFEESEDKKMAKMAFEKLFKDEVRELILSGKRPDGRKPDEIRELSAEVEILPRTHGSAIFNRGQTQALTISTLGAPSLEQFIETATGEETKRYIHHYSMPPYSVGETGRVGYPSRREVGHGSLAERALLPVVPSEEDFPYTIRLVTEVLSSNGSTSMAAVCGSSLSLMDAGVPIEAPVAGIAMGLLIEDEDNFKVLTDIVGLEDGNGDMDFKVAGTRKGVTALQLDVKTLKLTLPILEKAIARAKKARLEILDVMEEAISKPRKKVSEHAPKIRVVKIDPEKIGEVIGPGGRTIKEIIAESGALIDVDDDGTVNISGATAEEVEKAIQMVEAITKQPEAGEVYEGTVKRIQPFGAFVEILPGKEGLVHVSDMSTEYVKKPEDLVSVGDKVNVRVKEIDDLGRLNLSMVLDPAHDEKKGKGSGGKGGSNKGGSNKSSKNRKGGNKNRGRKNDKNKRSSGPHFPTSRLVDDKKN